MNDKRLFRFDVAQGLQNVNLADYKKKGTIMKATDDYLDDGDQQIKLQACTENLMEKECTFNRIFSPNLSYGIVEGCGNQLGSKFSDIESSARHSIGFSRDGIGRIVHIIFATSADCAQSYTLHVLQGSYDIKEFRDCRTVLRVIDVEKDRNDLRTNKGARVLGTFEWITTDIRYQVWQSSGPDALWITAGPGRGKTMLSLFILEDLEQYISTPTTPPGSIVQEEYGKKADLYYFFCSSEEGSRRGAVAVFRSLIHQIVSKH